GYATLARPYHDIENNVESRRLIDYGTRYSGSVSVSAETKFQGLELLYRRGVKRGCSDVDFLIGWRWLQLKDELWIGDSVTDSELQHGTDMYDVFDAANNFHGVEFGIEWERPLSCYWTLELLGKMAIGNTHSLVTIDGQTTTVTGNGTTVVDGGLLALDSNMGSHTRDSLSAITEIGLSLKRRLHCGVELTFGYSFVYWSDVLRAGDQVDLDVNLSQASGGTLVGLGYPVVPMKSTDFWAQGLHFGLEYDF
ncbi:MAG: BBP7 family outer membrane beta-barrel protein, partial [Pirellulales bacterium]|nr:BBP7 family outer membrane beta-barrel protein [Pirellulales bacterium]